MARPAVFLDRDGVLNDIIMKNGVAHPPLSVDTLVIFPDAAPACRALRDAGYLLIGATNQPDIARGHALRADVDAINDVVRTELDLDELRVCPHDDSDRCECRKPLPGMLLNAAEDHDIDLTASIMVGDRWKDIDAGRAAGCRTVFIDRQYSERKPDNPDFICGGLLEAVPWILT